jgi:hypothetical protein
MEQQKIFDDRRKDALQKMKTGYDALLKNLHDDMKYFAPGADEYTKEMFLEETEFKGKRTELKNLVESLIEIVSTSETSEQAQGKASEMAKEANNLKKKNLSRIVEEARPLEKSYRELELFFKNAGPRNLEYVTIINVDRELVSDSDDETLPTKIRDILQEPNLRIDQNNVYSLLGIPGFLGERLIQQYADIAYDNKCLFLTDYKDLPTVEATLAYRETSEGQKIGGSSKMWSRTAVFANWIRMREKYADLGERDAMYGSPAMAILGKLYATRISQPAAGIQFGEVKSSGGLRYTPNQPQVGLLSKVGLNPMADFYGQDSPWEATTLFDGENLELKHYAVVRTLDWIDKTLKHYLGKHTFEQLDAEKRNVINRRLVRFMEDLSEQKIISKGQITKFAHNRDRPDRVDLGFSITPLWATRTLVYKLGVDKTSQTSEIEV